MKIKIILALSLIANGVMAFYLFKQPQYERLVIETHADATDLEDERINKERMTFFTEELGFGPEQIAEYHAIRKRFRVEFQKSTENIKKSFEKPSAEEIKSLEQIEQKMLSDLKQLFGLKNWERYEKFRAEADKRALDRHDRENAPFLNMEI